METCSMGVAVGDKVKFRDFAGNEVEIEIRSLALSK
jgi:co-chaperonin GroES (HSP10)